jgi:iron complex transport system permease protein
MRRPLAILAALCGLLLAAVLLSLLLGSSSIDPFAALRGEAGVDARVLLRERLPRTLVALSVGAALATAGLCFQAILVNPLADPFVIGVSGGAAVGGTIALLLPPVAALGHLGVSGCAFLAGLGSIALTWRLSRDRTGRMRSYDLLLIGVVLNTFASAIILFLKAVVRAETAQEMLLWLMGTLSSEVRGPVEVGAALGLTLVGIVVLWGSSPALNALAFGEDDAASLGVDPAAITRRVFVVGSLLVAVAISVAGLIGFVGLIVPHAIRRVAGTDHRLVLPASALAGASFLILADVASRLLFPVFQTEAAVGVLTAFIGGPVFVWLLKRESRRLP